MPDIYLYAELLVQTRQLTLHASVQSAKNEDSRIVFSSDKTLVTAVHGDESASLYLPTQVSGTAEITLPLDTGTELSTTLQIDDREQLNEVLGTSTALEIPWSATEMTSESSLFCKFCKCEFVRPAQIKTWEDLNSKDRAKSTDSEFYHESYGESIYHSHAAEAKDFFASSKSISAPGTGFVDVVSFFLHENDCTRLCIRPVQPGCQVSKIHCGKCDLEIGLAGKVNSDIRLFKSRLSIQHRPDVDCESLPASAFVCAELLLLVENSVSRQVIIHSKDDTKAEGLVCWILHPDIYYSSSKKDAAAHRAMKILYKPMREPLKLVDEKTNDLKSLLLTSEDLQDLSETLYSSANLLPQRARTFEDWKVGLLERYERKPSGLDAMERNALNRPAGDIKTFELPEELRDLHV